MEAKAYRLPTHVRPVAYAVDITTQPAKETFGGRLEAELDVLQLADAVEMHSRDLELSQAHFRLHDQNIPSRIELDASRQTVRFVPETALPIGRARLFVNFSGRLNPSMHGIYLASDGTHQAICTQCEATDARGIFPCFDEPAFKSSLAWTIRAPKELLALSNGPLVGYRDEADGTRVWTFAPTRPVSSYLAALSVGDFEGTEPKIVNGVPLRVYAPKKKLEQTSYALDYTARLLPWYEEYFRVPYPFAKYDQIAVPGFDAGAMENVGLVLFRQNLLLMDPATASWRQEKLIAKVIAHEFAHMWFGNLVTMVWWDDLWLNEAFAEWMAHKAVEALSPDYRVWDDFQDDKNRALIDDALPSTHPIWTSVQTPEQAIEMFDVITYQKGCAVMRMLENFLGEDAFRDGLRAYMKAFSNQNATGEDLWTKLAASSGHPVSKLMNSWVAVPGFPIVACELEPGDQKIVLRLSQRRFFSSATLSRAKDEQLWSVPVVVRFEDQDGVHEHRFILQDRDHAEVLPAKGEVKWCYPNSREIGFFRLAPGPHLSSLILKEGLTRLSPVEQMGVLEDQWAAVRNASSTCQRFLEVLDALARRRGSAAPPINNHNVLRAVVDRLGTIDLLLEDSKDETARGRFREWVQFLLGVPMAELGYEPRRYEEQNDVQRRGLLMHSLAHLAKHGPTIAAAEKLAEAERSDPKLVDPNLAGTCIGVAARVGDAQRYDLWVATYQARQDAGAPPQTSLRYLYTLAEFRPQVLTERTLALIEDGTIPQEAVGSLLASLLSQRHSQDVAFDHLKSKWGRLRKRVGDMGISRLVEAVGALKPLRRAEIIAFFEENPPAGAERALARALISMDEREGLRVRITPPLLARFAERS